MSVGTNGKSSAGGALLGFAITILISSFLIFQVQPLISKYILPWFGGTPGVWTTCMLFFQVALFAGYAYAHILIDKVPVKVQYILHIGLLVAALALFPYAPDESWAPRGGENPTLRILGLLTRSVGLPYFLLSATGPLLQAWFSRTTGHANPYWLYALSNVGSLAGLISYPFFFEPRYPVDIQARWWSISFAVFAACCAGCAVMTSRSQPAPQPSRPIQEILKGNNADSDAPPMIDRLMWFALSACASVMLLATTNQVCLDIAVLPFLWVIPLTLYLLSFILVFGHRWLYPRPLFLLLFILSLAAIVRVMFVGTGASMLEQVLVYFVGLFVCCMVCHGELVRMKPHAKYLTSFYLSSSAGGAFGGILVGLVAPYVFKRYVELHIGLAATCLIVIMAYFLSEESPFGAHLSSWITGLARRLNLFGKEIAKQEVGAAKFKSFLDIGFRWMLVLLFACGVSLAFFLYDDAVSKENTKFEVARARNFYGVLKVDETRRTDRNSVPRYRDLVNGRILHGKQLLAPNLKTEPTTYYGETTGIGLMMRHGKKGQGRSVGLVGLGAGTMAAYGKSGDRLRFYEINPAVIDIAEKYFTFLQDARDRKADVQLILGDARLSLKNELERGENPQFDVLVLDAFSSDAIPVHLLTREAFEIYLPMMAPQGVIAIHISNRHFNLAPVVLAAVDEFKLKALIVESGTLKKDGEETQSSATWILVGKDEEAWSNKLIRNEGRTLTADEPRVPLWTDRYSNVLGILQSRLDDPETWKELHTDMVTDFWDVIRVHWDSVKGKFGGKKKKTEEKPEE